MNTLLTITGPSCAGKSTLEEAIRKNYGLKRITSFTTRAPRAGEVHGVDYYFLDEKSAIEAIEAGEAAEHVSFNGKWYGILWSELESKLIHGDVVVVVEPRGLKQLSAFCTDNDIYHNSVFITNPPMVLISRFLKRFKNDDKADIFYTANRIIETLKEQEWLFEFPYDKVYTSFDKSNEGVIINDIYTELLK